MGCLGLYLAIMRAVLPVTVNTISILACDFSAARTAEEASASACTTRVNEGVSAVAPLC